jgi:hypothetical protein
LTGVPSGAVIESGTPKKARKYSDGVSRTMSRPAAEEGVTGASLPEGPDAGRG